MTDPASPKPDSVPATGDPGDETASRYRYQWMYAAIVCCALLDDTANVVEVFCEHHEDILTKTATARSLDYRSKRAIQISRCGGRAKML